LTGLKGFIGIAIMISLGVAVLLLFAAAKIVIWSFRFFNKRVLDQF